MQRGLCVGHGAVVKYYVKKRCVVDGCNKVARGKVGKCLAHGGTPVKKCSVEGCKNNQKQGGKCKRHGAKCTIKRCSFSKCNKFAQRGGVCIKHGKELANARASAAVAEEAVAVIAPPAPAPQAVPTLPPIVADVAEESQVNPSFCWENSPDQDFSRLAQIIHGNFVQPPSAAAAAAGGATNKNLQNQITKRERKRCVVDGCNKIARGKVGKCLAHGGTPVKKCSVEGCQNNQKQGGKCKRHGAQCNEKARICIFPNCPNLVRRNGVCVRHGAKIKSCSVKDCGNNAVRRGICIKHGANSIGPELPGARVYKITRKD